jgi:hypothetical protein
MTDVDTTAAPPRETLDATTLEIYVYEQNPFIKVYPD